MGICREEEEEDTYIHTYKYIGLYKKKSWQQSSVSDLRRKAVSGKRVMETSCIQPPRHDFKCSGYKSPKDINNNKANETIKIRELSEKNIADTISKYKSI